MEKYKILDIIHHAIVEVSPYAAEVLSGKEKRIDGRTYLVDLGVNSIDYAHIAQIVMDELNVHQPIDFFARTNSINDVVDIFYDLTAHREPAIAM